MLAVESVRVFVLLASAVCSLFSFFDASVSLFNHLESATPPATKAPIPATTHPIGPVAILRAVLNAVVAAVINVVATVEAVMLPVITPINAEPIGSIPF